MTNTALITGASSGIGAAFARYHAALGGDLIITARREAALATLKQEIETQHGVTVHIIVNDLGTDDGADQLYQAVKALGIPVDILINNAGFGGQGDFLERDLAKDIEMINLNIKSLVALTHKIANDMVAQGSGKVLNVGSTAGFIPGPLQATYYATKAFVNSFSQAIDQEMRAKGVTCCVLTPGLVATEFVETADLGGTSLSKITPATPEQAAKVGYDAMLAGKLVAFNDKKLGFLLSWITPFLPRRALLKQIYNSQVK